MELRPGYKQTEVGVIPEQWEVKQLGEVGSFSKGKGIRKDEVVANGVPCIRYGEIYTHYNDYVPGFFSFIPPEVANKSKRLRKGDLLFAGSGETAEEIGKCVAFLDDKEAYAGGDIVILSQIGQDSMYLGYLMNHQSIATQKARMGQGDAVVHIGARHLRQLQIPRPPLPEQRAIARVLRDMDALLDGLEKLIAKKRDFKQAAMQQLLTGQTRLPGFNRANAGYKQTEVGVIPEEWEVKKLGEGIELLSGHHVLAQHCNTEGKGVPYITGPADFPDGVIQHSKFTQKPATICRRNDMLVTVKGSGSGTIVLSDSQYCISRQLMAIRITDWDTNYIYYCLRQDASLFEAAATGLIPGLSRDDMLNKKIVVPPLHEQTAIATVLSDMDTELAALEKRLAKTRALKQGMMQELLTGRTRIV